jgi:uncharacterized protein (DUF2384 family)
MTENKINIILKSLFGSDELVERWWNSPNKAFDEEIPDDLWHTSEGRKRVYTYVLNQLEAPH